MIRRREIGFAKRTVDDAYAWLSNARNDNADLLAA